MKNGLPALSASNAFDSKKPIDIESINAYKAHCSARQDLGWLVEGQIKSIELLDRTSLHRAQSRGCKLPAGIDPSRFKIIRMEGVQIRALIGKGGETIKDVAADCMLRESSWHLVETCKNR